MELILQHKPKAALNILGSGFSHPTSEDITTASNLKENQGKKPSIKDKIACLASLAWVSREITYCIVKVQQQRKCLYGHMLPQLEGVKGWKSETIPHNFFYEHYILINITRKEPISSTKKVIKPQTPN